MCELERRKLAVTTGLELPKRAAEYETAFRHELVDRVNLVN
jgi:hypothetical protein